MKCNKKPHEGRTCEEEQARIEREEEANVNDGLLNDLAVAEGMQRCPKQSCGVMVDRSSGCNHMTCVICKHEFCYVCRTQWR